MILRDPEFLNRLMVVQGFTQRELANAAGWSSHSYLGRLLRGEADGVREESARSIAAVLGVSVEDLFVATTRRRRKRRRRRSPRRKPPTADDSRS